MKKILPYLHLLVLLLGGMALSVGGLWIAIVSVFGPISTPQGPSHPWLTLAMGAIFFVGVWVIIFRYLAPASRSSDSRQD